jgi:CRP-like cAMP-binding protein
MREQDFDPTNAELLDQLRRIPPFALLDEVQVVNVAKMARLRKYEAGEVVIREGDYDHWVFFLIQGELTIQSRGSQVGTIRRLGDVFGEMGIIDGSPRAATITAKTPTLCIALDASVFDRLEGTDRCMIQAVFYRVFCEILAVRLRQMDQLLAEASRRP